MTREQIETAVFQALRRVAPESDPERLPKDRDLREELDVDSMDFLSFVTALHELVGVDIPERDYPRLYTLAGALAYLFEHVSR